MKPGYDSRPRVPAATPKREAVRLRMFETAWWQWSDCCLGEKKCMHDGEYALGARVEKAYLGVVLDAGEHDGVDGQLPFLGCRHGVYKCDHKDGLSKRLERSLGFYLATIAKGVHLICGRPKVSWMLRQLGYGQILDLSILFLSVERYFRMREEGERRFRR